MSKFSEIKNDNSSEYISESNLKILIDQLKYIYEESKNLIIDYILTLKNYCVIELSDKIILTLNRKLKCSTVLAIGYPFPIYSMLVDDIYQGVNVKLSIRGLELRQMQYQLLVDNVKKNYGRRCVENVCSVEAFKNISDRIFKSSRKIIYVDPNTFIGDSIIELKIIDSFVKNYKFINEVNIITTHSKHLTGFYNSYNYEEKEKVFDIVLNSDMIIISDLLDTHIDNTLKFLKEYKPNIPIIILSRNILICPKANKIEIMHLQKKDILLTNQGIHSYINDILSQFISVKVDESNFKESYNFENKDTIFINIFSSLLEKNLDEKFIVEFILYICKKTDYRILLSTGIDSDYTKSVIFRIIKSIEDNGFRNRLECISDFGLNDLQNKLKCYNILVAITSDTSISHMLTRCGYVNFTFYNFGFWDNDSIQSIAGESPIGYCSDERNQIPVIYFKNCSTKKIIRAIYTIIKFLVYGSLKLKNIVYTNSYYENRKKYDFLLKNEIDEDLHKSIDIIYSISKFSLNYYNMGSNEVLIKKIFEISPLTKIGLLKGI